MPSINYQFLLDVINHCAQEKPDFKVLDYGCGRGEIVRRARENKIAAYGADIFHGGPAVPAQLAEEGLLGDIIREIQNDTLPFETDTFDLVISNQVFEHVRNLDVVCKEIQRVLKPDGQLYTLFPPKEIIPEGHTGIPMLHWWPNNEFRYFYTYFLRSLGLGFDSGQKHLSKQEWAERKIHYIDTKTYYLTAREIRSIFNKYFVWDHREEEIINYRASKMHNELGKFILVLMKIPIIKNLGSFAFTRLAGYLIVATPGEE
jgi:SAM-dependent methyltransferase